MISKDGYIIPTREDSAFTRSVDRVHPAAVQHGHSQETQSATKPRRRKQTVSKSPAIRVIKIDLGVQAIAEKLSLEVARQALRSGATDDMIRRYASTLRVIAADGSITVCNNPNQARKWRQRRSNT